MVCTAMRKNIYPSSELPMRGKYLVIQFFQQFCTQFFVAGLAEEGEHVLLIGLHTGLIEGVHIQ